MDVILDAGCSLQSLGIKDDYCTSGEPYILFVITEITFLWDFPFSICIFSLNENCHCLDY